MMRKMKAKGRNKGQDYFKDYRGAAVGLAGVGIATGVSAGVAGQVGGAHGASLNQAVGTLASFTPIAATAVGGLGALRAAKGLRRGIGKGAKPYKVKKYNKTNYLY